MPKPKLFLIDANAFCYRAFYAIKAGLVTSYGQPTNAVYGFINMLNKIIKEKKPDYLAICFDVGRVTFRQKKFESYKINRAPMPEDLVSQMSLIKEVIRAHNLAIYELEGFEADDIIATLTQKASRFNCDITIVTSDKDSLQLIDENVRVFNPYKDEGVFYDRAQVQKRFGVQPQDIVDIVALMGDSVDNIPGVKGIGEKTAVELIRKFGSVKNLLTRLEEIKQERLKAMLAQSREMIMLSRDLAVLDKDVPIDFDLERLKIGVPDSDKLFSIYKKLEFKTLLKSLPLGQKEPASRIKYQTVTDKKELDDLVNCLAKAAKIIIVAEDEDLGAPKIWLAFNEHIYCIPKYLERFLPLLSNASVKKISHNLKETIILLEKIGLQLKGIHFDVMIAAYLLDSAKANYEIEELSWDYLKIAARCEALNPAARIGIIKQLYPVLEKELKEKGLWDLYECIEMPLIEILARMQIRGVAIDKKFLKDLSGKLEKRITKLIDEVYDLAGTQFNLNSPKQLRVVLFERLKLPVLKKTKTGASTDEEVLNQLALEHELPKKLLDYRQLVKLKSTYVDALPQLIDEKTGRIHASFNQAATLTGRLSSSEPNLQNIPVKTELGREIRRAIIAESGEWLLAADYSQIELRIMAHLSGDKELISAFKNDCDVHRHTASLIFGVDEDLVSDEMRETAKRVNFGIIYGMSAYGLSRDLNIPANQAQDFIDAYFKRYPKVLNFIEKQIKFCKDYGYVQTILGRRRCIPEIKSKNNSVRKFSERQAINAPIQGSAADLIKLAMINIHRELEAKNMKSSLILQVHDELVFEAPEGEIKDLIALVRRNMQEVEKMDVPIKVDIKKGRNWLEMMEVK